MIRNIVFDMGNVLLHYQPQVPCLRHAQNSADADAVLNALFRSQEWEEKIDSCLITEEEMLKIAQSRLPAGHLQELCARVFEDYHEDGLISIEDMGPVIRSLKDRGFGIYLLSNVGARFDAFKHKIPGVELFDGLLLSGEEKIIKPDPEIYQRLFSRFHLIPQECLFVDDRPVNVNAAKACGMEGYVFADENVPALSQFLSELPNPA